MDRHELWKNVDTYKRKIFLKNEIKKQLLKALKKNRYLSYMHRYKASYYLSNLPKIATVSYLNNRCYVSGRSQSIDRKTTTSRFIFRTQVYKSNFPGFRRSS